MFEDHDDAGTCMYAPVCLDVLRETRPLLHVNCCLAAVWGGGWANEEQEIRSCNGSSLDCKKTELSPLGRSELVKLNSHRCMTM